MTWTEKNSSLNRFVPPLDNTQAFVLMYSCIILLGQMFFIQSERRMCLASVIANVRYF